MTDHAASAGDAVPPFAVIDKTALQRFNESIAFLLAPPAANAAREIGDRTPPLAA